MTSHVPVAEPSSPSKSKTNGHRAPRTTAPKTTGLQREMQRVVDAIGAGNPTTRADPECCTAKDRDVLLALNAALDRQASRHHADLEQLAVRIEHLAAGELEPPSALGSVATARVEKALGRLQNNLGVLVRRGDELDLAHRMGDYEYRIDASGLDGIYRRMADATNRSVDGHVVNILRILKIVSEYAEGNFTSVLERFAGKEIVANEIMDRLRGNMRSLTQEITKVSVAAAEGRLSVRADDAIFQGDWAAVAKGVNATLDAVLAPLQLAASYVDRIGRGDIPPPITDSYRGDFATLVTSLNASISGLGGLVEANDVLQRMAVNDHTRRVQGTYQGVFATVASAINLVRDRVLHVTSITRDVAQGDLHEIDTLRRLGKRSEEDALMPAIVQMMEAVEALVEDATRLSRAAVDGKLSTRADAGRHHGDFRRIVQGVNDTLDAVMGPLNVTAATIERIGSGEIPPKIAESYAGDFGRVRDNLNACIDGLRRDRNSIEQAAELARKANAFQQAEVLKLGTVLARLAEGDLTATYEVSAADRDTQEVSDYFRTIARTLSQTIGNLAGVLREIQGNARTLATAADGLNKTAQGVIESSDQVTRESQTAAVSTDQASSSIGVIASSLEEISGSSTTVASASEQVSANLRTVGAAVEQVSSNMQNIVSTSGRMSSSVNSVAAAIEEMSVSLNEVAKSSGQAANVAQRANFTALSTAETVEKLGKSAQEIGKVVEIIKGIAAQTNLLALNATIEAASAGDAGRGFAVVANEVKELAKQTAAATEDIRNQVGGMQANTQQAIKAIDEIVRIIQEINTISASIAASVEEQTATTNEIAKNVGDAARGTNEVARNVQQAAEGANEVSRNVQHGVQGAADIARSISQLATGANEAARSSAEAAKGMSNVARNVATVSVAAKDASRGAADASTAARDLASLADKLQHAVGQFRV